MKRLICIICVLGFTSISNAKQPTPEHVEKWQSLSENLTYHNLYVIMGEMAYFSLEPWPEPLRQVLLKMATTFKQMEKDRAAGKPIIIPDKFAPRDTEDGKCSGEIIDVLLEATVRQKDPRFLFFFENWGLGGWPVEGLAGIGEPAFETVIKAFNKKGWVTLHQDAAGTLELMLQEKNGFLQTDLQKREITKQTLLRAAQEDHWATKGSAIRVLRFFPDADVSALLKTISLTDPYKNGDQFPLRAQARKSLEYLRTH